MTETGRPPDQAGPWPEDLPPCLIKVDKEGRFWHLGAEMTHEGINRLIMEHVELDDQGRYVVEFAGSRCLVEVEDTFFVITRVKAEYDSGGEIRSLVLTLNDGRTEPLAPESLTQTTDNVMYAKVKSGRFPARFLRRSYYQLAEFIVEKNGHFVLPVGGREHRVA